MSDTLYRVREHETFEVPADRFLVGGRLQVYEEVQKRGYFQVRASGDKLVFQAGGSIGLIPVNDRVTIEVIPRTPIANLDRLLRIAGAEPEVIQRILRSYGGTGETHSIARVLIQDFVTAMRAIAMEGRLKTYERSRHVGAPRSGRIMVSDTLRYEAGHPGSPKVVTTRFDRTAGNIYNASLKRTAERLSVIAATSISSAKERRTVLNELNDAWTLVCDSNAAVLHSDILRIWRELPYIESRAHKQALSVAVAVLSEGHPSAESRSGALTLSSLIFDLSVAFEAYVRNVLAASPSLRIFDGNLAEPLGAKAALFQDAANDSVRNIPATPDIIFGAPGQRWAAADVKYKPYGSSPGRDDLNQGLTYTLVYGVDICLLIYPAAKALNGLQKVGTVGAKVVYSYGLDLQAADIEAEERDLITAIASLGPPPGEGPAAAAV